MKEEKIACPQCNWEPHAHARWMCNCGHVWNTFDTGGQCPACGKQWKYTCCLSCQEWSLHIDWYRSLDDLLEELLEEVVVPKEAEEVANVKCKI